MIQWATENTIYWKDKPSRLYLLFTKAIYLEKDMNHECPFRRSDRMVQEIEIKGNKENKQEESYKKKRWIYAKANHTPLIYL